jgi:uncharacterized lipoprotein YddW (UPF0748 family)
LRRILVLLIAALSSCAAPETCGPRRAAPPPEPLGPPEVRGSWVVGNTLADPESVRAAVDEAVMMHLNTLMVQARARGDAIFASELEPQAMHLKPGSGDLLAEALRRAPAGVEVHAWVNACLVANADALPSDPRHVTVAHPEWMAVPEELAAELFSKPPRDPSYREALAEYAAARKSEVEGLFCDPVVPEYRAHVVAVAADLLRRYRLAGIHLDYIRYPSPKWGYSRTALELFRADLERDLPPAERAALAGRARTDPSIYARKYPARFADFRRAGVTRLVEEVGAVCRQRGVLLTAAVFPDLADAREKRLQDWGAWLSRGLLDAACPMVYTTDAAKFEEQVKAAVAAQGRRQIWAGMGAWKLDAKEIARRVEVVREERAAGVILFSHHSLRGIAGTRDALIGGPFALKARRVPEI